MFLNLIKILISKSHCNHAFQFFALKPFTRIVTKKLDGRLQVSVFMTSSAICVCVCAL